MKIEIHNAAVEYNTFFSALVSAFQADPVTRWQYSGEEEYLSQFPVFANAFGGKSFEYGTAYSISGSTGLTGITMWLPPDVHPDQKLLNKMVVSYALPINQHIVFIIFQFVIFPTFNFKIK